MKLLRSRLLAFLFFLLLLILFPFLINLVQKVQQTLTRALGQPADIVINTRGVIGPLPKPWLALSQGGEEAENMLSSVISETEVLKPEYIRIDHIYDFYDVVSRNGRGNLLFDFTKLDRIVDDILKTGALPFFSLSYMPSSLSQNDNLVGPPQSWNEWSTVVQATIEHYSGKNGKNLKNISYEVWNEPDLFGHWQLGVNPDYLLLYRYSAKGAQQAKKVNQFFLGGPSTTGLSLEWLQALFKLNTRLDFISWHRYAQKPATFKEDTQILEDFLEKNPQYFFVKKYITEWGSIPETSTKHDTTFDAAHTVATVRQFLSRVDLAFSFEIKDGPSPEGKKYWGRWGVLTHEQFGKEKKPRYHALKLLADLDGERLSLSGEGTWVTGFATKKGQEINLVLVNFDPQGRHVEKVPITFINLENPGIYSYEETPLLGETLTSEEKLTTDVLQKTVIMPANSVFLIKLSPTL